MTDRQRSIHIGTYRGRLTYRATGRHQDSHRPSRLYRNQRQRPIRITITQLASDHVSVRSGRETIGQSQLVRLIDKLAVSRDGAFRFLRSVISPKSEGVQQVPSRRKSHPQKIENREPETNMHHPVDYLRRSSRAGSTTGLHGASLLARPSSQASLRSVQSNGIGTVSPVSEDIISNEKPVASNNGVAVSLILAEPVLYLQGFNENDTSGTRSTAMLRGSLHLKVQKNAKIKAITLRFKGTAMTKWPEGIPPKKQEFEEVDTLMSHTWPFFNAQFDSAEGGSCADSVRLADGKVTKQEAPGYPGGLNRSSSPMSSSVNLGVRSDGKRLSLGSNVAASKSFDKSEAKTPASVAQTGYRTFYPGDYLYNFELPLDSRLPESIDVDLGSVKYELEAVVERSGAFRANLLGTKEIILVRAPSEGSLEQVEPIAISRNWEDQLHYDIVISGKSHPLGAKIPVAFKLTPLAKVQCHRIKVFITENTEYFCANKKVHRTEPTRKVLLFEKRSDGTTSSTFPGSSSRVTAGGGVPFDQREAAARGENVSPQDSNNLLGALENNSSIGPTEMEFNVQLPGCHHASDKERMNRLQFDTTYQNIRVHHWIKIVMRLSRPDAADPAKRRHFEISIDSPFHILSCRANRENTALPAYSSPDQSLPISANSSDCGCPGAARRRISTSSVPTLNTLNNERRSIDAQSTESLPMHPNLARPPTAHFPGVSNQPRPMHMLRAPSFNPPAFEDEEPPPPLVTPPPQYGDIASPTAGHGLADYFTRLATTYDEGSDDSEGESGTGASVRGRVNVPLTPGGRLNRSFDIGRQGWVPLHQPIAQ